MGSCLLKLLSKNIKTFGKKNIKNNNIKLKEMGIVTFLYIIINRKHVSTKFIYIYFFSIRVFFHRHWRFTWQKGKGGDHLLFYSTTSARSRTFTHLFATLHVRWLSGIFNRNACIHQTATRSDLPPCWITNRLIGLWCLLVYSMIWF